MAHVSSATLAGIVMVMATAHAGPALVRAGKSAHVIVVAEGASVVERTAAEELRSHLLEMTSADLPIVDEGTVAPGTACVWVGSCQRSRLMLADLNIPEPGPDGIIMRTVGDDLILTGSPPRGTLYAVYTFLEDVGGCRWWTSTESSIPKIDSLTVPDLAVAYTPALRCREAFYRDAFSSPFAARLKLNGHFERIPPEYGGHTSIIGWCHTFFQTLPPQTYFAEHPEWYSMINGKRTDGHSQLCLINKDMLTEYIRLAREQVRRTPEAGMISVSQNDWGGRCQCPECLALEEREGSPSGPLLLFVNAVAEALEDEFPDLLVETLAYQYTRQPPKTVRPRHNVVVRLCSIECSYVQPLETGEQNITFRNDIEAWKAIAPKLYIWNYVTNFSNYIVPHPNLRVLAPNLRYFVKNHAIALFEQGDAGCAVGDFVRLRTWLLAHLLWNPDVDEKALITTFLHGYYGAAGPHLQRYLDVIHDAAEVSGVYLGCYIEDTSGWLRRESLEQATAIYAQALAAVEGDPVLWDRVRRERLPLDLVVLQQFGEQRTAPERAAEELPVWQQAQTTCNEFIALCKQYGVCEYREGRPFNALEANLLNRFQDPGPPPKQCAGLPRRDWEDFQDCSFNMYRLGSLSRFVDDPDASDGRAALMPGGYHEWAVQCPLRDDLTADGPWRVFIVLRCDAQTNEGPALTAGVYDARAGLSLAVITVPVADLSDGAYHTIELGPVAVNAYTSIWVAPPKRPGEVTSVTVDRMTLIRDEALKR